MQPDIEIVNGWFEQLLDGAIQETEASMSNEHLWEPTWFMRWGRTIWIHYIARLLMRLKLIWRTTLYRRNETCCLRILL